MGKCGKIGFLTHILEQVSRYDFAFQVVFSKGEVGVGLDMLRLVLFCVHFLVAGSVAPGFDGIADSCSSRIDSPHVL